VFALPKIGHVFGIDRFDSLLTQDMLERHRLNMMLDNLFLVKGEFCDVLKGWNKPINILHIDGTHDYESVKQDFDGWSTFVKQDGVILLHDTISYRHHVGRLFNEIDNYYKLERQQSEGLGILTQSEVLHEKIRSAWF